MKYLLSCSLSAGHLSCKVQVVKCFSVSSLLNIVFISTLICWRSRHLPAYRLHMSNFNELLQFRSMVHGSSFCTVHHNQFLDAIITCFSYDIKKLIVMQKLEPRTVGLKPTKIGHRGLPALFLFSNVALSHTIPVLFFSPSVPVLFSC